MSAIASSTTGAPLPLVTTFRPASACLSDLWAAHSASSIWMNLGPIDTAQCLPSGWSPSSTFSPGICPSGWIMASNSTTTASDQQVTIGTCCPQYLPSNWVFSTRPAGTSKFPWYTTEICQWAPPTTVYYGYTWTTNGTTTSAPGSMTPGGLVNAYGIVVEWQSSNSLYPMTATATTTASSTSSPTDTAQQSADTSSGLTTGAKAGIGAGVAVGAIIVSLALGFLIFRRRKRQRTSQDQHNPAGMEGSSKFELVANERHELSSTPLHEAESKPRYTGPFELDGDQR